MTHLNHETIIGIDLGTTNSEVAVVQNGKVIVLKVDGSKIIPSVVSKDLQGQVLIGRAAVNNELAAPTDTIRGIKRKMGRDEVVSLGNEGFTPQMISSLILKRLKLAAEEFLKHPVHKAVITVPAFFNEKQREATKEAAELAGLEPVRLLNEPTAAALAYSIGKQQGETCLVYDLGGGTFDVSIVHLSGQLMEVKASHGDTELGGSDFDRLIADKARQAFKNDYKIDLADDPLAWARLMRSAEAAKIRLSTDPAAEIVEEFIASDNGTPLHLKFKISLPEFEAMIRPALERTLASIQKALEMANLSISDIHRIILVGGATYTPLVTQMIENEFKMTPQAWVDPSTVVAMGAAVEAASLAGESIGPVMVDITPHSLGTGCYDEYDHLFNVILIRRNTPLPCSASQVFYKKYKEQHGVQIKVYQGESINVHQCQFLGKFLLDGLEESQSQEIHIKYELDRSGLLHVTVTDIATGKKANHTVKRVAHSRVKQGNLAEMDSVRIKVETLQVEQGSDEEFWEELGPEEEQNVSLDNVASISLEGEATLKKAQALIESGQLDPVDQAELSNELEVAKAGNPEALKRLTNLIYYLE